MFTKSLKSSKLLLPILILLVASQAFGHGMSEAEKQAIVDGGNLRYIWIGATHMLTGYDHLAFVFGIIFFLTKFKDIVKYVTAFTLGHSITLIFATFMAIKVNYFLIDAIIALSVIYIGFHNLDGFKKYLNINAPNMMAMIFGLGLIHGLGLSTRLQQLPLSEDNLLMNIISFNVGIELGQILALAVMLVLIAAFRKSDLFGAFSKVANILLMIVGALLFVMQMQGYFSGDSEHDEEITAQIAISQDVVKSGEVKNSALIMQQDNKPVWKDTFKISIPAVSGIEQKVQVKKGATVQYTWVAEKGDLYFDLHGDPKGDTTGYFKSFKEGTLSKDSGSFTTVFEGKHGWYWKNTNPFPVQVTLKTKGDYELIDEK
ncbi:hypothetical protein GQR58_003453 [Nymphon striatum]|nr:hypothetical protein GQR58_003453 [Nymphon striatum]